MSDALCGISATLMALTAAMHSWFGEKRLLTPMLALNTGVLAVPLARFVIRFAWHLTSLLILLCAAAILWPESPIALIRVVGVAWLLAGIVDAVGSKGRHIGWPPILLAGLSALASTY